MLKTLALVFAPLLQDPSWDDRARAHGFEGDPDRELMSWIEGLAEEDSEGRRREIGRLAEGRRRLLRTFRHPGEGVLGVVRISADGRRLVTQREDIWVWDAERGRRLFVIPREGPVAGVAVSSNGERVAVLSESKLRVYGPSGRWVFGPGTSQIWDATCLQFASAGDRVAIAGEGLDGPLVELWDLDGNQLAPSDGDPLFELPCPDMPWSVGFSPDGSTMAVGGGCVRLWDTNDGQVLATPQEGGFSGVAFHSSGKQLGIALEDSGHRIWDITAREFTSDLVASTQSGPRIAFDPARDRWVAANRASAYSCNAATGELVGHVTLPDALEDSWREKYSANPVVLSPDGAWLAIAGVGDTVRVWDTFTGRRRSPVIHHGSMVTDLAFTNAGHVVTASDDGVVRLWSNEELEPAPEPREDTGPRVHVAPDGERAVVVRETGRVRLFDLPGGALELPGEPAVVSALAVSADGSTLAGLASGLGVQVWDVKEQTRRGEVYPQGLMPFSLALDSAGQTLAVGTVNGIRFHDLEEGRMTEFAGVWWGEPVIRSDGRVLVEQEEARVSELEGLQESILAEAEVRTVVLARDGSGYLQVGPETTFHGLEGEVVVIDHPDTRVRKWLAGWGRTLALQDSRLSIFDHERPDSPVIVDLPQGWDVAELVEDRLVVGSTGRLHLYRASDGLLLADLEVDGDVYCAIPVPGREQLAASVVRVAIDLIDVRTNQRMGSFSTRAGVQDVTFGPEGRALVVTEEGSLHSFELESGRSSFLFELGPADVRHLEVSADGSRLVTVREREVELWDLPEGERVASWSYPARIYRSRASRFPVMFSASGKRLLLAPIPSKSIGSGSYFQPAAKRIVDARTGAVLRELAIDHDTAIASAAIDADGAWVALALWGGTVEVWSVDGGRKLFEFPHRTHDLTLTFGETDQGQAVLTATGDSGSFASWSLPSGEAIQPVTQLKEYARAELRSDARLVHSVDDQEVTHLVDLLTGENVVRQAGVPEGLTFGPDPEVVLLQGPYSAHLARIEGGRFVPMGTRAIHYPDHHNAPGIRPVLRADGTAVLGTFCTRDGVRFVNVDFRDPGSQTVDESVEELRATWSDRLGLEFDAEGRFRSRH